MRIGLTDRSAGAISASEPKGSAPAGTASLFSVDHVSYQYQAKLPALVDVSLSIQAGQKVAILGANGSGKSTLLKLLDGLYFPTSGEIRFRGARLDSDSLADEPTNIAFRRSVGLVFQDPDVQLFSPTVWEEVAFGPLQLGLSRDEVADRVRGALDLLGIAKLADRVPYGLSGGEKKKVSLASVLVLEPDVLLLDEPTASLDPRSQRTLVDLILEVNELGRTVVTATHDLDVVAEIADQLFVFGEDKTLVRSGSPAEILSDHGLLLATNLAHAHRHHHGSLDVDEHEHPHLHHDLHGHPSAL